jgi:hypothetical protein
VPSCTKFALPLPVVLTDIGIKKERVNVMSRNYYLPKKILRSKMRMEITMMIGHSKAWNRK